MSDRQIRRRQLKAYPPDLFAPHAERFWRAVTRNEGDACWPWTGHVVAGRGMFFVDKAHRDYVASRVVWAITHQADPGIGIEVCHRCDNPLCVRPDHLFLGTPKDNAQDRVAKGRGIVRKGQPREPRKPWVAKPLDMDAVRACASRFELLHRVGSANDCWEWISGDRRPLTFLNGQGYPSARIAWAIANDRDPGQNVVRHTCDNERCVNPAHLVLGSHADNARDRDIRGLSGRAKLTADAVLEMRRRYAANEATQEALAAEYGVSTRQVWHILARRSWAHVD